MKSYEQSSALILSELSRALAGVEAAEVEMLCREILAARKVFVVGVGRVLLSLQAFVKRANHLGIRCWYVGELNEPAIAPGDLLLVGSGSGESLFPREIAAKARSLGARVALIGAARDSSVGKIADIMVRIPASTKRNLPDDVKSEQLMSSLFEQALYLLLDAVALMIAQDTGRDTADLWQYHANLE